LAGEAKKKGRDESRPYVINCLEFLRAFALLQLFDQLRDDFEEVADHAEVRVLKGPRVGILSVLTCGSWCGAKSISRHNKSFIWRDSILRHKK
jgi:hypothetical protein